MVFGLALQTRAVCPSYCAAIEVFKPRDIRGMPRNRTRPPFKNQDSGEFSMSLDSDVIVDRRRIRRKLTFWRVVAALVMIAAIVTIALVASPGGRGTLTTAGSIARINIEGLIRTDQKRVEALEQLENSHAAAVVVHINS